MKENRWYTGYRRRLFAVSCLAGSVFAGLSTSARADDHTRQASSRHHARPSRSATALPSARPALPRPATRRPHAVDSQDDETVSVRSSRTALNGGGGMMRIETAPRTVQTIGKQFIDMRSPTSTALDLVQNLPSLNVTTPDSSGMEGGQIQSRGLTDLDMGLMMDGAPAAAAKYLTENVDSENLENVSVTPGSSATDLPVMSAAGGVMMETTRTPSKKFGGMTDFSYGTNNLSREFIRLDSGEIGHSGVRGYFSFSNSHARSWMGAGINQRKHIDFGLQKDWQNGSNAKFFLSWNSEDFVIDNYPTSDQFFRYKDTGQGYGRTNDKTSNNYWKNNNDHWNQIFLTAPVHIVLPAKFSFDIQPYFNFGQGWDASPNGYTTDSTGTTRGLTSYFLQNEYRQVGAVTKLNYQIDSHNLFSIGYWYENTRTIQSYPESYQMANGAAASPNWAQYLITAGDQQNAGYEIHSLFVHDTAKYLHDHLTVDAGFKFVMTNIWNKDYYGRQEANRTAPLPQLSIGYRFDNHHQIYLNVEGDYRQPSAVDLGWLYTSVAIPKNQYSIKEELGYRYHDDHIIADVSFFNYNVTNRIVDQYVGMNSYKPFNIGNQQMRGFDVMVAARPIHGFSPYASVEYLHATQDSNVFDPYLNTMIHSKGTQAIMAPHVIANFGLTYTYKGFFANGAVHYTGPQSVSVAGDQRIPGYVTNTLSLGYHFKPFMFAKSPTFKLNFTNLTGSIVRTGAMGAVYSAKDPSTVYSGNMASYTGYGNSFMVAPRFTMTGTVSTAF
ncbi:TonB-dependent receptor [Gluconobacter morbifer]|uniref:TonB-dependent outer membrane receptor n=1 Tax=Gluconobacter morbifer G707 TaxID=1088869 RepID=G6XK59_9PROT|nr:TonB-dependent receptor plug domain-containing protein [Gluconobacter morbifer]EHH68021.1 tonB-dependent outer membrane receptor [Gluconobacter morbifer G707]